jgi:hypothetical protein
MKFEYPFDEMKDPPKGLLLGFILAVILLSTVAAGFGNIGPFSSLLYSSSNPLADAEAVAYFDNLDELVAADGSGLDDLATTSAYAGAIAAFKHATSSATLHYKLVSGSPSQDLPWTVLPDDNATSNLYFSLEAFWLGGIPLVPSQTDTTKFYQIFAEVDGDGDVIMKVDDTAITITD